MAKRFTDSTIWKNQRWFKKLSPIHKLAWKYITDTCDHAGILKVDFSEFIDDLGIDEFDVKEFIKNCNTDFDKENGRKIERERIKLIKSNVVWLTGFIKFQYEGKEQVLNPKSPVIKSALTILNGYGVVEEGLVKGYYTLSEPYVKGIDRDKDKDKDKDIILKGTENKTKKEETIGSELTVASAKKAWDDQKWRESICMGSGFKEDELRKWMSNYNASIMNDSIENFNEHKYKKMFGGWLQVQKSKGYSVVNKKEVVDTLRKL